MTKSQFTIALRFALRELRGGLRGFYIFLACIALGTGAIAAVNSVAQSITYSIEQQGQALLGGDIRFALTNREANADEKAYIEKLGPTSRTISLRTMARRADGSDQTLVEVKSIDDHYPLYGTLEVVPPTPKETLFAPVDGRYGAVAAQGLLDRLQIKVGDTILLGSIELELRAVLTTEPDALSDGMGFAPRLMTSNEAIEASGLVTTGSLVRHTYKVRIADMATTAERIEEDAKAQFPKAGWSIRSSRNATPALTSNIERFSQFLTLVALTALIAGGVGVANAVRAYLDTKRGVIATFKCLGAPANTVTLIYLFQIMIIAVIGVAIGLILGALAPQLANSFMAAYLPVETGFVLYPTALIMATAFGLLTALAFAILPLGQARRVPATALFRKQSFEEGGWPERNYLLLAGSLFALIALLAVATASDQLLAAGFLGAVAIIFALLRLVSFLVSRLAKRAPRTRFPTLRLAIGNIHRPGALTTPVILSLGLGLTLLVTLALIDGNLRRELNGSLPERAPDFFFVDIQSRDIEGFEEILKRNAPNSAVKEVPMLRGRITALNGNDVPTGRDAHWVVRGDRGLTYSQELPEDSRLVEGQWWPADYAGEPLVSFALEEAQELGLKVNDTVTVNVLGRPITARIANFRQVEWQNMSINFVMVFSPNTFRGAPHSWIATLDIPEDTTELGRKIVREVTNTYPGVTTIDIRDAINTVGEIASQLAIAIRAAGSIALVTSILVLAGALAAGNQARIHDAVVMKTLGATRITLMKAYILEYALLGIAVSLLAVFAGGLSAWAVVALIMELPSTFLPGVALVTLGLALTLTVGTGLAGTWRILGQKAAPVLREL